MPSVERLSRSERGFCKAMEAKLEEGTIGELDRVQIEGDLTSHAVTRYLLTSEDDIASVSPDKNTSWDDV